MLFNYGHESCYGRVSHPYAYDAHDYVPFLSSHYDANFFPPQPQTQAHSTRPSFS